MVVMRCRAALAVPLVLALGACTKESPRMPSTCVDTGRAGYEKALAALPGPVRLPGGVAISTCAERVHDDAELQNLGAVTHAVAEALADRAENRSGTETEAARVAAARQYGFLSAALAVGAARSNGITAELARRVENAGAALRGAVKDGSADSAAEAGRPGAVPAAVTRALDEGAAAGADRG
jgi:hypothetical protein